MSQAYVTLATNDGYAIGALVLGHSLRSNNTTRDLCIMITPTVSPSIKALLHGVFNKVISVDVLDSGDSAHLSLLKRPELGITFTKLHCWTLTEYSKCVFLDADMLCVQNPDELFSHPELTAVTDIGWPDCFNSGMFVFVPSRDTYAKLLRVAEEKGSFDGGDQGLLNTYFTDWHRISFVFNMVASATYTYLPAYKQFGVNAKLIHFLGSMKPWQHRYDVTSGSVQTPAGYHHLAPYLNSWWAIYIRLVQPGIPEMDIPRLLAVKSPLEDTKKMDISAIDSNEGRSHSYGHYYLRGGNEVKDKPDVHNRVVSSLEQHNRCVSSGISLSNDKEWSGIKESENVELAAPDDSIEEEVAQQLAGLHLGQESIQEGLARWERGEPDYLGRDSFANIQAYIDSKLKSGK